MIRLRSQLDYLHWDRPCATTADIGADGADNPRRADHVRVAKRANEVDDDEEDRIGKLTTNLRKMVKWLPSKNVTAPALGAEEV